MRRHEEKYMQTHVWKNQILIFHGVKEKGLRLKYQEQAIEDFIQRRGLAKSWKWLPQARGK